MNYSEAPLSCSFRMFSQHGGDSFLFTVRGDNQAEFTANINLLVGRLEGLGYSATQDAASVKRQKSELVDGIVVGTYIDKRTQETKKCLHLYTAGLQFKFATLYPESFGLVPQWALDAIRAANTRAVDSAPDRERAVATKVYFRLPRPLTAIMQVVLDHNNEVKKTDKGYVIYRPASFVESGSPVGTLGVETEPLTELQPAPVPAVFDDDVPF